MRRALEWSRDGWTISTDARRLQLDVVHGYLARSYWAEDIPREIVARSIENSLCFGVYERGDPERQVGFARVITDFATFAWIGDVFVLEEERGKGLATWLMEVIAVHPDLQGLRRWNLVTRDAHGLYRKTGFVAPAVPESYMERRVPDAYRKGSAKPPA
ncbi:MAG TPA: GNAT family N-acetyltransferase [Planctomycetota bacterium]|jgi:GNAT superfamily N-acetyltransferase|nr:GNAT family N-acetyltransferase [Planctomycetota bacterium]